MVQIYIYIYSYLALLTTIDFYMVSLNLLRSSVAGTCTSNAARLAPVATVKSTSGSVKGTGPWCENMVKIRNSSWRRVIYMWKHIWNHGFNHDTRISATKMALATLRFDQNWTWWGLDSLVKRGLFQLRTGQPLAKSWHNSRSTIFRVMMGKRGYIPDYFTRITYCWKPHIWRYAKRWSGWQTWR